GEVMKVRRQIEHLTQQIYQGGGYSQTAGNARIREFALPGGGRIHAAVLNGETVKKSAGRPKKEDIENAGGNAEVKLPKLIEDLLAESKTGLTLSELLQKI